YFDATSIIFAYVASYNNFQSVRSFFFFNAPPTTEIYTLSLHDALPIYTGFAVGTWHSHAHPQQRDKAEVISCLHITVQEHRRPRSEEHTSELQSQSNLVCRLLLEKKKKIKTKQNALLTPCIQYDSSAQC